MNKARLCSFTKAFSDLPSHKHDHRRIKGALLLHHPVQTSPCKKFHHNKGLAHRLTKRIDLRNVRMIQLSCGLRLALKVCNKARVIPVPFLHHLDGDLTV